MNKKRFWKQKYYLFCKLYDSEEIAGPMFTRLFNLLCQMDDYLYNMEV